MHRQFVPTVRAAGLDVAHRPATWLAAGHPGESGSAVGRIVLVLVAVLAVGAFTMLQVRARSRERSSSGRLRALDAPDWRTLPPPRRGADNGAAETPPGGEGYRPDRRGRHLPGYEPRDRGR